MPFYHYDEPDRRDYDTDEEYEEALYHWERVEMDRDEEDIERYYESKYGG